MEKKYNEPNMPLWAKALYLLLCLFVAAIPATILYWGGYALLQICDWLLTPGAGQSLVLVCLALIAAVILLVALVVSAVYIYCSARAILWALGIVKDEMYIPTRKEAADLIDEFVALKGNYRDEFDDAFGDVMKFDDPLLREVASEFLEIQRDYEENAPINNGALSQLNLSRLRSLSDKLRADPINEAS